MVTDVTRQLYAIGKDVTVKVEKLLGWLLNNLVIGSGTLKGIIWIQ